MNKKYFLVCEALNYASLRQTAIKRLMKKHGKQIFPENLIGQEVSRLVKSHWKTMGRM